MKCAYVCKALAVGLALSLATGTALAQTECFLKIEDVRGEAVDAGYRDWIEVLSFIHEMERQVGPPGATFAGRAIAKPLVIVKPADLATPALYLRCAMGAHMDGVELVVRRGGGSVVPFLRIRMDGVQIVRVRGFVDKDGEVKEEVALSYRAIRWEYTRVVPGGRGVVSTDSGWDLVNERPL